MMGELTVDKIKKHVIDELNPKGNLKDMLWSMRALTTTF